METVYLETTIVGHVAGRLHPDPIIAVRQQVTRDWLRNPITEEIREIRHQLAAECGNDVQRIGAELRRRQSASARRVVRLPKRSPTIATTNNPMQPSGESGVFEMEEQSSPPVDRQRSSA